MLDIFIHNAEEKLRLLQELKKRRMLERQPVTHRSVTYTPVLKGIYKGKIATVECNCGEIVRYRKPINSIEDFVCPKDKG